MSSTESLSNSDRATLLDVARASIQHGLRQGQALAVNPNDYPAALRALRATFVTLEIGGQLRGCIGALEAYQPLAEDVREHAIAAALEDPRFPPVVESELSRIRLEVSRLTAPQLLEYSSGEELLVKLNPHVDGVILKDGRRRATFLPQVWEKIPDTADFLDHLCDKMGARINLWRDTKLEVFTYQVEEFHEKN